MILQKKINKKLLFENHCHYIFIRKIPNFSPCTFFGNVKTLYVFTHALFLHSAIKAFDALIYVVSAFFFKKPLCAYEVLCFKGTPPPMKLENFPIIKITKFLH